MPLHWTSKIWFLGKSKGDDHVPIMYFKKGGSGEYTCLYVDRGTWGTTSEAAHNDCPGRKTWAAGTGWWGRRGLKQVACDEDSFSVYSLPLVLFSVMDDMSPGWLLWLSHSPLPVSSCSHSNSRIKQDAPHHKWAQQDHPGIHRWIPPFTNKHLRGDTALLQTLCHWIFTVTLGSHHIIFHGQMRKQLLRNETICLRSQGE